IIPTFYLGNLSQLTISNNEVEKTIDLLCILSGPEPQRSILEEMICSIFQKDKSKKCVLIQGKKTSNNSVTTIENIEKIPFANSNEIENYFQKSKIIICRSGYSTIMDLIKLRKNAILIPTPGQREQEYLGAYLEERKYFLTATQQKVEIENGILRYENVEFKTFPTQNMEQYKIGIDELLKKIS
nr:hypothetical protein [Chitinophagaceae bacterium]